MSTNLIQSLNPNLTNERTNLEYPHVVILEPSDALALVISSMCDGTLPVICTYEGVTRELCRVRNSALALKTLSRVSKIKYCKNVSEQYTITSEDNILEVF